MIQARRVDRIKALSQCESVDQGGKTGGTKRRACLMGKPALKKFCYAVFLSVLLAGFGLTFLSIFAFTLAANSCFTLRAMASVSTL